MQQTTNYPRYQLSDRSFHAEVEGGQLCSLKPGPGVAGQRETQYILPGRSFGELRMAWSQNGKEEEWLLEDKAVWSAQAPEYGAREVRYTAKAEKEGLPVTVEHRSVLADGIFRWEYRVKNISDKPLELLDFGMPFPCNTQLQEWGVSASDKVIGHNFIGGHGSHLVFERCDGQGPFLLALPQDGTALEYIAMEPDVRNKGVLIVYALSAKAVRAAKEKQTRRTVWGNSCTLQPGAEYVFAMRYVWAADYEDARKKFAENGLIDVEVLPGYTVPQGSSVSLALTSQWEDLEVKFPYPEETEVTEETCGNRKIYRLKFRHPGENIVYVQYAGDRWMPVSFFVTQPLKTLIEKRGAFIASHQHTDPEKWYYGLLAEWNNETGALLGPDNYDLITGWRIYEVTCDDPGLSKPAFLSGKLAEYPEPSQIEALDRYVENFVWGGLQCTEDEQFPYGIYGIPDWKQNRDSSDDGVRGKLHIWRIYDYPHISLMYYNLYRIARDYPDAPLSQTKETYLRRACATAVAMFTIPLELDHWDALKTGLYNELCIEKIIAALREEGMAGEADRLERHWERKMKFFVLECTDLFGSEYPFDTTGFESTHALAKHALKCAENTVREDRFSPPVLREQAENFMERQMAYNIACRGVLEPAYYWYGSDYRSTNATYTMSYMSQMGGWAILDYALKYADDPYALLRLGYGSVLSSWALVNAGEEKDN